MAGGCLFQSMHKDAYHGILDAASNLFYLLMFQCAVIKANWLLSERL